MSAFNIYLFLGLMWPIRWLISFELTIGLAFDENKHAGVSDARNVLNFAFAYCFCILFWPLGLAIYIFTKLKG